ncbi:hypothetical protein [Brevibacillus porteri]|uniref:hypothetical protein n=1 Tax=Brevibacillus porteri TaxID=2126350 RepID=UPI003D19CAC3
MELGLHQLVPVLPDQLAIALDEFLLVRQTDVKSVTATYYQVVQWSLYERSI